MTTVRIPSNAKQLATLAKVGEGPTLEFKRSTGELKEGMQTLCAFLNGSGGMVLFGVIGMCRKAGIARPIFEENGPFAVVRFRVRVGQTAQVTTQVGTKSGLSQDQVTAQVTAEVTAQVAAFCREPKPAKVIIAELGLKHWKTFQTNYLAPLMAIGVLERTIPDKPRSRMQRYMTTEAGLAASTEPERES